MNANADPKEFLFFNWMTALTVLTKQYSWLPANIHLCTFFNLSALLTKTEWSSFQKQGKGQGINVSEILLASLLFIYYFINFY